VAAEEWKAVVLKTESYRSDGAGGLIIELASGKTLRVSSGDWSNSWSNAIDEALAKQRVEKSVRSNAEPPSDSAANVMIRSHCTSEWPDDFRMRKYCEDQQKEGLSALRARRLNGSLSKIRTKCAKEWPDDFRMRDYCEKQQLKAVRELGR
jgi:hypothetical protein